MDFHLIFRERLRSLRKEKKETQVQVANALSISDRHYQKFESGANLPSFENLWALADHFGVSVDYLMGRSEKRL
ncbi:MAG: helix-turn-helix transcriptional regulator [Oscillibacter sp.]|nr:helix-turn-helix transcriptional regulator [Oscillibacter sp.]